VTSTGTSTGRARRHTQDDWLDQVPSGHRAVFDGWMADTSDAQPPGDALVSVG